MMPASEGDLAAVAGALIETRTALSPAEAELVAAARGKVSCRATAVVRGEILAGSDPLGEAFCRIRSPAARRTLGATYTPRAIITSMLAWAVRNNATPVRVIDPGCGSGRFLAAAAERFPAARLIGIDVDPLAVLLLRANAAVAGFADRLEARVEDFRAIDLPPVDGATLFIGNPPYVRHHAIDESWKRWFADAAASRGLKASKLAGLHVHFFLKTLLLGQPGDLGCFVTAAEWLDVNYGRVLRQMLADGLGGSGLHVLDATALPFAETAATAAISCFHIGRRPQRLRIRAVPSATALGDLSDGQTVGWNDIASCERWSTLVRRTSAPPSGFIELGELFRVHRGQVTGGNAVWIEGEHSRNLPARFLLPAITRARELLSCGSCLLTHVHLRRVIDLPSHLDSVPFDERTVIEQFLDWLRAQAADRSYIAQHRRTWWSVGLRPAAPILCTYMARRPPAFVRNACGARHINIAHGLYPRQPMGEATLSGVVAWLRSNVRVEAGRTYAGGLTKFEPREIERLRVPPLAELEEMARLHATDAHPRAASLG